MTLGDFKLYSINTFALGVTTFTQIEMGLKIFLLLVTIGYTLSKWVKLKNTNNYGLHSIKFSIFKKEKKRS